MAALPRDRNSQKTGGSLWRQRPDKGLTVEIPWEEGEAKILGPRGGSLPSPSREWRWPLGHQGAVASHDAGSTRI